VFERSSFEKGDYLHMLIKIAGNIDPSFEKGDYLHMLLKIAGNIDPSETTRKTHSSIPLPSVI
jgi:hypothetical protein